MIASTASSYEKIKPKDLFDEVKLHINLIGGTLSGDDTVIAKPYSDPNGINRVLLVGITPSAYQRY